MTLLVDHAGQGNARAGFGHSKVAVQRTGTTYVRVKPFVPAFTFHRAYATRAFANFATIKKNESLSSREKDGKIDKYEHVKVCMMPQITDMKRADDTHLDLDEKLYGAALMGLPCNKVDPVNFWYVDTKKHAPYQYPQPKGITIPGKVWDSDNGSWVDEE